MNNTTTLAPTHKTRGHETLTRRLLPKLGVSDSHLLRLIALKTTLEVRAEDEVIYVYVVKVALRLANETLKYSFIWSST
jgi:hypothetical protein